MELPELALKKEHGNTHHIYLYYMEERWWTFGYSAFYLNMIHKELKAGTTKVTEPGYDGYIPCMPVQDSCLLKLTEIHDTLVYDTCIQVDVPPTIYCYRNDYEKWCKELNG